MEELLKSLAKTEIEIVESLEGGSQFKLWAKLADGNTAIIKPMRYVFGQFKKSASWYGGGARQTMWRQKQSTKNQEIKQKINKNKRT